MKSLIVFVLTFSAFVHVVKAMPKDEASSSSKKTKKISQSGIDMNVINMLRTMPTLSQFEMMLVDHKDNTGSGYTIRNARLLHAVYLASATFDDPCDASTMETLIKGARLISSQPKASVQKLLTYLIQDKSPESYVQKCIEQFDRVAEESYTNDEEAKKVMSRLMGGLSSDTRKVMNYERIVNSMNPKIETNLYLRGLTQLQDYTEVCNRTNNNETVTSAIAILSRILMNTSLKRKALVDGLKSQIQEDKPNSTHMFCLAMFCKALAS